MARVDLQAQTAQPLTRSAVYFGPYGVSVTATATCRYTALLSVAKSSEPRLESLLILQPGCISLHEWCSLGKSARAGVHESLLLIANSRASLAESTLGQEPLRNLCLESLRMLTPNISGRLEGLSHALAETAALTEYRFGLQSAREGKQEILGEAVVLAERISQQEWLSPLARLAVSRQESLFPTLIQEAIPRQESLSSIHAERQINTEYAQEMALTKAGALEWLSTLEHISGLRVENARAIAQALDAALEILATAQQDTEALVEILYGLQRAREAPWEALSESEATIASRHIPHEILQPLSSAVTSACESAVATLVATALATEQLIERIASNAIRQEQLLPVKRQNTPGIESLAGDVTQRAGQLEQLTPVQAESIPNLEQLTELAKGIAQRLESLSTVMALARARDELLALIQQTHQTITESLSQLAKQPSGAWESLATLTQELAGLQEQLLGIAPSTKAWQETLGYIAADNNVHAEWLIPVLQELSETYENLFPTITATAAALTEHRQGIDQSVLLRLELLKRLVGVGVAATRTAVYEVLRPVRQKRSGAFEKRSHVRAQRSAWQELWGIIETLKASEAERARAQAKERISQSQKPQAQADAERKSREAGGKRV
jgi:hypothetical protein